MRAEFDEAIKISHLDYDHQLTTAAGQKDYGFTIEGKRYYGDGVVIHFPGRLRNVDKRVISTLQFVQYQPLDGRVRANSAINQAQQAEANRRQAEREARSFAEQYVNFIRATGGSVEWP